MPREDTLRSTRLLGLAAESVREEGAALFANGDVHILETTKSSVSGFIDHERIVDRAKWVLRHVGTMAVSCTCWTRTRSRKDEVCAHLWALLLAAESKDIVLEPTKYWEEEDEFYDDAWDDQRGDEDDYSSYESHAWLENSSTSRAPDSIDDWRHRLLALRHVSQGHQHETEARSTAAEERVVYVLDSARLLTTGEIVIRIAVAKRKANGDWGTARAARLDEELIDRLASSADRRICSLLRPAEHEASWYWRQRFSSARDGEVVRAETFEVLLPLLCDTGRFEVDAPDTDGTRALTFDDGPPWRIVLRVDSDDLGRNWLIRGTFERDAADDGASHDSDSASATSQRLGLDEPWAILTSGWIFVDTTVARFEHNGSLGTIYELQDLESLRIPEHDGDALVEQLRQVPNLPTVEWPEELRWDEVEIDPRPMLHVNVAENDPRKHARLRARIRYSYDEYVIERGSSDSEIPDREKRRVLRRSVEREDESFESLISEHGFRRPAQHLVKKGVFTHHDLELPPNRLSAVVPALIRQGWHVEAEGKTYRHSSRIDIKVSTGIDWFDVHADVEFGDQTLSLPDILAALRRGENSVPLGDGTFGVLPESWIAKNALLLSGGKVEDDHLRFRPSQVMMLDALLAAEQHVVTDEPFQKSRERLRDFDGIEPIEASAGFYGELRPYQKEALGWFRFLEEFDFGGCLADDMGLGKTVQVLALLERRRQESDKPSIVIVPRSLVFNWIEEAARFTPELRVLDHAGPDREKSADRFADYDVVITTYGLLVRDAAFLAEARFDYAILDEAQAIKNESTTYAKAARLLKADHRLALSGTPVENHLGELWRLFEFLNPGMLGTSRAFKQVTGRGLDVDRDSLRALGRALRPVILRRTKSEVADELPDRVEQILYCELEGPARKKYDELRDFYRDSLLGAETEDGLGRMKIQVLEALLRLRQAACHVGLIDPKRRDESSPKLDNLLERLEEVLEEGHKALVFSQFTKFLSIVRDRFDQRGITYEYLDGRTRKRKDKVERFQSDEDCKVFLISLKAGGFGLNLTAADYVFLLDPWWNPAAEAQAIDRTHRIGQHRSVVASRLIARDTVEEKVLELQGRKRALADELLAGQGGLLKDLDREDLEMLLS